MEAGTVLVLSLLDRKDLLAEVRHLKKFLLNLLQAFLPLAVSDLGLSRVRGAEAILCVQLLKVSDLLAKTPDFFSKNLKVIHRIRITHFAAGAVDKIDSAGASSTSLSASALAATIARMAKQEQLILQGSKR
jgi:hypothetical protein